MFHYVELDMADSWKTISHFIQYPSGNATRLAKLRRELQECDLWRVVMI
jgi:hypothetical protein